MFDGTAVIMERALRQRLPFRDRGAQPKVVDLGAGEPPVAVERIDDPDEPVYYVASHTVITNRKDSPFLRENQTRLRKA